MESEHFTLIRPLPEEYKCPYHGGLLQDPVVSPCGHSFCKVCVDEGKQVCPLCDEPIGYPLYPNNFAAATISQLEVKCNYSPNCNKIVKLGELSIHRERCTSGNTDDFDLRNSYQGKVLNSPKKTVTNVLITKNRASSFFSCSS